MAFKDRLKRLRGDKGITQEELAKALDFPDSTIRRYESADEGYPRKERLEAIADYFGCSVDYLMGRTDDPKEIIKEASLEGLSEHRKKAIEEIWKMKEDEVEYFYDLMKRIKK